MQFVRQAPVEGGDLARAREDAHGRGIRFLGEMRKIMRKNEVPYTQIPEKDSVAVQCGDLHGIVVAPKGARRG